jgi:hypothetical protein
MNIHINKEEHIYLQTLLIEKHLIGSRLYEVASDESDTDYLCIFKTFPEELESHLPNFHQFQYKDIKNNIDYIYSSELQFYKNLSSGDSTINADVILFSEEKYSNEEKLNLCRTNKIIKAYLGFAKRDLKQIKSEGKSKLKHAYRGLTCAKKLIENELPTKKDISKCYQNYSKPNLQEELDLLEKELRLKLNQLYNSGKVKNYHIVETENQLFNKLLHSNNIKEFHY